jgi:hypothetical protein
VASSTITSTLDRRLVQSQSAPASGLSALAAGGSSNIRLPRAQNPTITLLQKARGMWQESYRRHFLSEKQLWGKHLHDAQFLYCFTAAQWFQKPFRVREIYLISELHKLLIESNDGKIMSDGLGRTWMKFV